MAAADDDGAVVLPHAVWLRYDSIRKMREAKTPHSTDTPNAAQGHAQKTFCGHWFVARMELSPAAPEYTLSRDRAIFELPHPPPPYHGIPFSILWNVTTGARSRSARGETAARQP